jgi:general secretion pathway protein D
MGRTFGVVPLLVGLTYLSAFAQGPALPEAPVADPLNAPAPDLLPQPRPLRPMGTTGDPVADTPIELVEFRDLPLSEAMRLLSEQSGLKIVPSAQAARTIISLYLRDVSPLTAVAAVAQANGLIYRRDPTTGIVRIFTTKENQLDLASFREDQTEVYTLLYPNALNVATAIRDLFGSDRVQLSYGVEDNRIYDDLQDRLQRFDLINDRSLGIGFGGFNSSSNGGLSAGGVGGVGGFGGAGGGGGFSGTGVGGGTGSRGVGSSGGVRQSDVLSTNRGLQNQQQQKALPPDQRLQNLTPEEIQQLEDSFVTGQAPDRTLLLELLRRRPATIFVTVIRQHNQLMVRSSDPQTLAEIHDLVCRLDVPTPVVLLEVKVLLVDLTDDFNSLADFQFTNGLGFAGGFSPAAATTGPGAGFSSGNILPPAADALDPGTRYHNTIAPGPLGTAPAPNALFQIVSANFRARLQFLENKNRVTQLATPLVMTANNEVSQIFTGQSIPITVGFTPGQAVTTSITTATTVQPTPITTYQNIGTSLLITPNINADRTVTLRLLQEQSTVVPGGANIPLPNSTGNGVTQVAVDTVQRQNFTGTIVAKDGMAIAVAGLINEGVNDQRAEVPIIGHVPLLGFFFRQQSTQRMRQELVLVIRPFVLTTPAESTDATRALVESLSIHPNAIKRDLTTLGTYSPPEVLRPNPPANEWENIFKVHTISPKDF